MKTMKPPIFVWLALTLTVGLAAQTPKSPQTTAWSKIDLSKLGPQVGEHVPDFSLKDQNGKTWTLQSIMGPKGAMLSKICYNPASVPFTWTLDLRPIITERPVPA